MRGMGGSGPGSRPPPLCGVGALVVVAPGTYLTAREGGRSSLWRFKKPQAVGLKRERPRSVHLALRRLQLHPIRLLREAAAGAWGRGVGGGALRGVPGLETEQSIVADAPPVVHTPRTFQYPRYNKLSQSKKKEGEYRRSALIRAEKKQQHE